MADNLYITVDELRAWLDDDPGRVVDANGQPWDDLLEGLIGAVCRQVDDVCGRVFYAVRGQTRVFYPDRLGVVHMVDLMREPAPVVLVDLDYDDTPEAVLSPTDYIFEPQTDASGLVATRYQRLRRSTMGSHRFCLGRPVGVTGDWGYVDESGAAPETIRAAVRIAAARLFMRRKNKLGRTTIPETGVGETLPTIDPDVDRMLRQYVHERLRFAMA